MKRLADLLLNTAAVLGLAGTAAVILYPLVVDAARHELREARTAPIPNECPAPTEHERLHVVLVSRDGRVAVDGCLYVGSRGTYHRTPLGMPGVRP